MLHLYTEGESLNFEIYIQNLDLDYVMILYQNKMLLIMKPENRNVYLTLTVFVSAIR